MLPELKNCWPSKIANSENVRISLNPLIECFFIIDAFKREPKDDFHSELPEILTRD